MTAAAALPNWVMLEPFVFRRDDEESFPDESKAPFRASGTTSWNSPFHVAFSLAKPPLVSRIYARFPGFPGPREQIPLAILATHRHLALLRVGTKTPGEVQLQDLFVYDSTEGNACISLKAIPHCTEPGMDFHARRDGRRSRRRPPPPPQEKEAPAKRRLLRARSMGILCRGEQEFAVAELKIYVLSITEVCADICLLRPCTSSGPRLGGEWNSMRLPIPGVFSPDDLRLLCRWQTNTVIPFNRWLCWIDYYLGIVLCDVFEESTPTVSFRRFPPLEEFPFAPNHAWMYRGVSAIHDGHALSFVNVARYDGIHYGELKHGAGFTVTCYSLKLGSKDWTEDYKVTSDQLWFANPPERLPRDILMYPQVNIDRPHEVNFLITQFRYVLKKVWVVTIDMKTKTVESFYPYTNGREDIGTEDADLTESRSYSPSSFLPWEFSKFLHLSSVPSANEQEQV